MEFFVYKNVRPFQKSETETVEITIYEGFNLSKVLDFAIGKTNETEEQLVVRLDSQEDKDLIKQFPVLGKKGEISNYENRIARRYENTYHIINDTESIQKFKTLMGI